MALYTDSPMAFLSLLSNIRLIRLCACSCAHVAAICRFGLSTLKITLPSGRVNPSHSSFRTRSANLLLYPSSSTTFAASPALFTAIASPADGNLLFISSRNACADCTVHPPVGALTVFSSSTSWGSSLSTLRACTSTPTASCLRLSASLHCSISGCTASTLARSAVPSMCCITVWLSSTRLAASATRCCASLVAAVASFTASAALAVMLLL